jgi:hypothetical protein
MQFCLQESARTVLGWLSRRSLVSPALLLMLSVDSCKPAKRILVVLPSLAAMLSLASCASSSSQSPIQPPILTYGTLNAVYTRGTAITPNTPTDSGGAANSYSVTPALPAGLSLNPTTGVISGTRRRLQHRQPMR